jgi:photosystem II stability/assembly factor-like uncharacterized protein
VVVLAAALGLSALGDGDREALSDRDSLAPTVDPGPIHVHGLGVNPSDGTLFIATHTGMWRVGAAERDAERVGDKLQDTMGFTVVGADRFLGSGHPDPRDIRDGRLPPLLGLIESKDAGNTWRPISLLGKADFHVLRSFGKRIYGYDATNDRLMISLDAGRSWKKRQRPAPLVDLAADPGNTERLVAAGKDGLYRSGDEGQTWELIRDDAVGLLTWPRQKSLFLVDGRGQVFVSPNGGRRWTVVGRIGGQPAAFLGRTATELYVALHDGTIKRSADGGRTWTIRSTP